MPASHRGAEDLTGNREDLQGLEHNEAACDDYSMNFDGDDALQNQWSKYVDGSFCHFFPVRLDTLCARPYPQ